MRHSECRKRIVEKPDTLTGVLERIQKNEYSIDLFHQICCLFLEEQNRGPLQSALIETGKQFFLKLKQFHEDHCIGELLPDFKFKRSDILRKNTGNCVIRITALLDSADDYQYVVVDEESKGKMTKNREKIEETFSKVEDE